MDTVMQGRKQTSPNRVQLTKCEFWKWNFDFSWKPLFLRKTSTFSTAHIRRLFQSKPRARRGRNLQSESYFLKSTVCPYFRLRYFLFESVSTRRYIGYIWIWSSFCHSSSRFHNNCLHITVYFFNPNPRITIKITSYFGGYFAVILVISISYGL